MTKFRGVAVSGYAGAGKDTLADVLVGEFGYRKDSMAADLKRIARDEFGWDGQKDERGRRLLQTLGTECGRRYDPDIWLRRFAARVAAAPGEEALALPVVVPDVRFVNELEFVRNLGFVTIWVRRPGVQPALLHESETALQGAPFDHVLVNDGTMDEFHAKIYALIAAGALNAAE